MSLSASAAPLVNYDIEPAEYCVPETRETFERHLFAMKFLEDASCQIFYRDAKKHTACWKDTKSKVGMPLTSVICKE